MMNETEHEWEKAITAVPIVRGRRKVKVERKDGTVEERDAADVVAALVEQHGLYAALRDGVLPPEIQARRAAGLPDLCATCGEELSMRQDALRKRNPDPSLWSCRVCVGKKLQSSRSAEQRSEAARKALSKRWESMTPKQRSDAARKAWEKRTPKQRSDAARKAWEKRRAK